MSITVDYLLIHGSLDYFSSLWNEAECSGVREDRANYNAEERRAKACNEAQIRVQHYSCQAREYPHDLKTGCHVQICNK